jgi:hypothetical protein
MVSTVVTTTSDFSRVHNISSNVGIKLFYRDGNLKVLLISGQIIKQVKPTISRQAYEGAILAST